MDSANLNGAFVSCLCRRMDWGPAAADLDLCVLTQSERAQSAAQQHDGAGHKSKVRCVKIYFWDNRQTEKRRSFHYS